MAKSLVLRPLPRGYKEPQGVQTYVIDRGGWVVVKWLCEHSVERYDLTKSEGLPYFYDHFLYALKNWRGGLTITSSDGTATNGVFEEKITIWPSLVVLETFQKMTRLIESRSHETDRLPSEVPRRGQY